MAKVLIVDDNLRIREYMRECLTQLGFTEITEAKNGWDALKLSEQSLPDIITLDWNMPEMDGLEYLTNYVCCRAVKSRSWFSAQLKITRQKSNRF